MNAELVELSYESSSNTDMRQPTPFRPVENKRSTNRNGKIKHSKAVQELICSVMKRDEEAEVYFGSAIYVLSRSQKPKPAGYSLFDKVVRHAIQDKPISLPPFLFLSKLWFVPIQAPQNEPVRDSNSQEVCKPYTESVLVGLEHIERSRNMGSSFTREQ
jgi:hypothetical protein